MDILAQVLGMAVGNNIVLDLLLKVGIDLRFHLDLNYIRLSIIDWG
jgi:hypothetical protein